MLRPQLERLRGPLLLLRAAFSSTASWSAFSSHQLRYSFSTSFPSCVRTKPIASCTFGPTPNHTMSNSPSAELLFQFGVNRFETNFDTPVTNAPPSYFM